MLPNDHFPVCRTDNRLTWQDDAFHLLLGLDQHSRGLAHHQRGGRVLDGELKMGGMQLQNASDALKLKLQGLVMVFDCDCGENVGWVESFECKGFDPHRMGIDDVEHLVLRRHDLPCNDPDRSHLTVDRRAQFLRLASPRSVYSPVACVEIPARSGDP